jgi:hypothetical protein
MLNQTRSRMPATGTLVGMKDNFAVDSTLLYLFMEQWGRFDSSGKPISKQVSPLTNTGLWQLFS